MNYQVFMLSYQHNGLKKYYGDCYMELYRFRSCDKLLGDDFKELEDQYFYFAPLEDQNDPLEGYIDFFWQGDNIAWEGIFRNYIWQMFIAMIRLSLCKDHSDYNDAMKLYLYRSENLVPKELSKLLNERDSLEKEFLKEQRVSKLIKVLADRKIKISRISLPYILFLVHLNALKCAGEHLNKCLELKFVNTNFSTKDNLPPIFEISDKIFSEETFDKISAAIKSVIGPLRFRQKLKLEKDIFIKLTDFPEKFTDYICNFAYPKANCVCFNTDMSNPALWGYYANNHSGVCLTFEFANNDLYLRHKTDNKVPLFEAMQVNYDAPLVKRNFFNSLGSLFPDELSHWLITDNKRSTILDEMREDNDEWRKSYWADNTKRIIRKSKGWKSEKEYRIWLDELLEIFPPGDARKYCYKFENLKEIIFGIRTPFADKKKIVDILNRKCKENNRKKFPVYQAQYDKSGNYIKKVLLMNLPYDE